MPKYNVQKLQKLISLETIVDAFVDYDDGDDAHSFCEIKLPSDEDLDCLLGGISREKYDEEYHPIVEPRGLPKKVSNTVFNAVLKTSGRTIVRKPKNNQVWGDNANAIFSPYRMKIENNVLCVSYLESSEVEQVIVSPGSKASIQTRNT